jgi:glucose/arabinose dehydrogenase
MSRIFVRGGVVRVRTDGSIPNYNSFARKEGTRADLYTQGNRNPLGGVIHPGRGAP